MALSGYQELTVWKQAYEMTLSIYGVTREFPKDETYGLVSQMRRASTSIIANIAEGYGKKHLKEYIQFISISIGSCNELEVYLCLSKDLGYLKRSDYEKLRTIHESVSKMLQSLRRSLENKDPAETQRKPGVSG